MQFGALECLGVYWGTLEIAYRAPRSSNITLTGVSLNVARRLGDFLLRLFLEQMGEHQVGAAGSSRAW